MNRLVIYGASDDLIEIEGAIRDEFNVLATASDDNYLAFSDGTVLAARFSTAGIWEVRHHRKGFAEATITPARGTDDEYTDRATLTLPDGYVWLWVVCGPMCAWGPG